LGSNVKAIKQVKKDRSIKQPHLYLFASEEFVNQMGQALNLELGMAVHVLTLLLNRFKFF
jgi:hypothetical protein